jgi:hypothetical protein
MLPPAFKVSADKQLPKNLAAPQWRTFCIYTRDQGPYAQYGNRKTACNGGNEKSLFKLDSRRLFST